MRLLLDSHILLRWDSNLSKLSRQQNQAMGDTRNEVFVSAVTAWELGIKCAAGKLALRESVQQLTDRFGFRELVIRASHGRAAASLPTYHRDPFDRMLIAQAIVEDMTLVSSDSKFFLYPNLKLLS